MADAAVLHLVEELLARQTRADLLLERQTTNARILHAIDLDGPHAPAHDAQIAADLRWIDVDGAHDGQSLARSHLTHDGGANGTKSDVHHFDRHAVSLNEQPL